MVFSYYIEKSKEKVNTYNRNKVSVSHILYNKRYIGVLLRIYIKHSNLAKTVSTKDKRFLFLFVQCYMEMLFKGLTSAIAFKMYILYTNTNKKLLFVLRIIPIYKYICIMYFVL